MLIDIVKVFLPSISAFVLGILMTPPLTNFLYKHKMWKKKSVTLAIDGSVATISASLHNDEQKKTPRMGGIVVWVSTLITCMGIWLLARFVGTETFVNLDFLSRNQTWLPLATLIVGALVGLIDDYLVTRESPAGNYVGGGLSLKKRLLTVGIVGLLCALWFYFKLDVQTIGMPEFLPALNLGILFIPFFIFTVLCIYAGGVIDGIDGLSGGIFATMFASYAGIAFYQQQYDLAAFCATIVGAILAFLWFNIPPARYYMSDTGMMGLTITLAIVAFMTDTLGDGYGVLVLPIIAFPLVVTVLSNVIQILSKKFRNGKKVFLVAPIHNHFQAKGWPAYKVTMRFWIIGVICALLGLILALIG
jgi:phospho-N-acetylmuramoyl-pentapeptide-transferase